MKKKLLLSRVARAYGAGDKGGGCAANRGRLGFAFDAPGYSSCGFAAARLPGAICTKLL